MGKKTAKKLNPKQEFFCELYASTREFFGNGVQSYIEAYDINTNERGAYNTAKTSAYDLLTKPYILDRINELLELRGLNDSFVDKQLEFLITQNADLSTKVRAINEYNKLKSRITDKLDLTTKGKAIEPTIIQIIKPDAVENSIPSESEAVSGVGTSDGQSND